MGLRGDFAELGAIWKSAPWRVRVWLVLSGFLASASIASLSEAVAKWKGFLLTGITFYRIYIRDPIAPMIVEATGVQLTRNNLDFLCLSLLLLIPWTRRIASSARTNRSATGWIIDAVTLIIMWGPFFIFLYRASGVRLDAHLTPLVVAYLTLIVLSLLPPRRAADLLALVDLLIPPLLVCMLAAINHGLK